MLVNFTDQGLKGGTCSGGEDDQLRLSICRAKCARTDGGGQVKTMVAREPRLLLHYLRGGRIWEDVGGRYFCEIFSAFCH